MAALLSTQWQLCCTIRQRAHVMACLFKHVLRRGGQTRVFPLVDLLALLGRMDRTGAASAALSSEKTEARHCLTRLSKQGR